MSPVSNSTTTSRSPHTRLAQTAADVSSSPLADAHAYIAASRKPAHIVLNNNLIPRDYLTSSSGSRSGGLGQQGRAPEVNNLHEARTDSHDVQKSNSLNIPKGKSPLNGQPQIRTTAIPGDNTALTLQRTKSGTSDSGPQEKVESALSGSAVSYTASSVGARPPPMMPRTSSIDSAISNISGVSLPQKPPGEVKDPSHEDVYNLIATAGSAESLIAHLLRDKSQAAAQNAQLWKLVDKQRVLLLGLNKDLERMTKERDRYRKKAKEVQIQPSVGPDDQPRPQLGDSPQSEGDYAGSLSEGNHVVGLDLPQSEQETPSKPSSARMDNSPIDPAMMPPPLHLQQAPRTQSLATHLAQPVFSVTEATPLSEKPTKSFQASRKAPPRPLDLRPVKDDASVNPILAASEVVISDGDDDEDRELLQRGRRKTREEDDRERELLAIQEQEARSQSKKEQKAKGEAGEIMVEDIPQLPADLPPTLPPSQPLPKPPAVIDHLSPTSTLSVSSAQLSNPLRSPGLPMSPRPFANTLVPGSLPMSPRAPASNFPLSPRAPKQALPAPTTPGQQAPAPDSQKRVGPSPLAKVDSNTSIVDPSRNESPLSKNEIPAVDRSLMSPTWPDFLLPPNALPSIQIKVASSRLRPSRNSIIGLKAVEENSVFSLSVFERATSRELWRIEKMPSSVPNIDQQLRPYCEDLPKLPDRRLFTGHSPAMVDARRAAIETYFEGLLDTPMDEKAATIICRFLSTDVLEPQPPPPAQSGDDTQSETVQSSYAGIPTKSGYLTKKGKNFGGWKSRYFVLDSPELRYFEAPGGAHLGTIKLLNARIGKQSQSDPPSSEVDSENQYRHAFLILEPKRKDMNSHVRHVLCAENDFERDEWVETLLHYIDEKPAEARPQYGAGIQASYGKDVRSVQRGIHEDADPRSAGSPQFNQSLGESSSPSNTSSHTPDLAPESGPTPKSLISKPMNATVIPDAGLWGNKHAVSGGSKEREQKKRNLFSHFRRPSHEQLAPVQQQSHPQSRRAELSAHRNGHVRPVFGMQLQEAVEYYSPVDVNVYLPAVVYRCIEFLRVRNASSEEGLFRLSGSNIVIRLLKERFNTEGDIDLLAEEEEDYDVHAVASLFKTYLRELPATILTRELHLDFLKVLELDQKPQKIAAYNGLVHQLPPANFHLLRALSQYLLEVVQNSERNKMSVKNVGIVFSPTLNIPAPVFAMFLTDFEAIFERPSEEDSIQSTEFERKGSLTPEDIRSPRRQMFSDLPTPAYNQSSFSQNATMTPSSQNIGDPDKYVDTGEFGFSSIQPSYETRSYVSVPHEQPIQPRYGGANNMLAPDNAASVKAKRRESSMLFL
ncbi:RalA-binding protein 1 [Exophiala viscosa]|uniref:RalA-binding protein 1 n=1 Tax=Exophiala viscosa TaxID=2486360 RepID=UPI0021973AE6|nr:RalA-binding protein 1 [Exophiala viscosa]